MMMQDLEIRGITMTDLLEKALTEIQNLSSEEQDAIAALILEEIADERKWDEAFSNSQDQLAKLADKVRKDIQTGDFEDASSENL